MCSVSIVRTVAFGEPGKVPTENGIERWSIDVFASTTTATVFLLMELPTTRKEGSEVISVYVCVSDAVENPGR